MLGFFKLIGLIFAALLIIFFLGPRPDMDETVRFDASLLGDDLDAYLAASEAKHDDLRKELAKEIIWADPVSKAQSEYSVIYLHGFSASKVEIAPTPQNLAKALGANLFLTRLAGHGRDGDAMAEARLRDWLDDVAEAIAIGERLGRKTILVSTSTGGTLSTWAAANKELTSKIAGMILISPNFAIQGASTGMLNMPWAETILPLMIGPERSFEPANSDHAAGWTYAYPSKAVFPMAALLRVVENIDKTRITTPTLFIYSRQDSVVQTAETESVIEAWGAPKKILRVEDSSDAHHHVIAGDILSPNTTEKVTQAMIVWAEML